MIKPATAKPSTAGRTEKLTRKNVSFWWIIQNDAKLINKLFLSLAIQTLTNKIAILFDIWWNVNIWQFKNHCQNVFQLARGEVSWFQIIFNTFVCQIGYAKWFRYFGWCAAMIPIEQSVLCEHRRDKRLVQRILFVFHLNIKRLQCVCLYSVIFVIISSAEIFLSC